ncbi:MAG: ATP-dependent zinc metalloprotease FtsH [Chloroflexi bacterium]|jgi:cell division protease FtsH|nr:ATP-dependent zinc metalloprotease FtsH [Chloroflexota bacterium]
MNMLRNKLFVLIAMVAVIAIVFTTFQSGGGGAEEISFSKLISEIKNGEIKEIEVKGETIYSADFTDGTEYKTRISENTDIHQVFTDEGITTSGEAQDVTITFKSGDGGLSSTWATLLINFLPIILFGGLLIFLLRRAQSGPNQAMGFAKSKAKMFAGNQTVVTFADVAGVEESKEELQEIVEFLQHSEKFLAMGARIPKGVLLVGPPGTGKTLLSRAVAGEAGVPFFSISGSEFVEMFVGVGAARVRDLFDQAKRNAPCIVFVDEIDAVGRHRGAGLGGGHDEREQTLNQILSEMDGFETNANVIVLAATNRPDVLDPALLRPGRFDRRVVLDLPDINGRRAILEVHSKGKPLGPKADLEVIAKETPGFSGADLSNLVNEAAILATRRDKKEIELGEFEESIDRVIAGPERKSRVMTAEDKKVTAYHEAGHALVARSLPNADPVHKVSIVARGMMLGYMRQLPTEDRYTTSRSQFNDRLATLLGGHVAEEVTFADTTTGASNDLERATQIARTMIMRYGMSNRPEFEELPISAVLEEARAGNIECVEVYGNDLLLKRKDSSQFRSRKEDSPSLIELLQENDIDTEKLGIKVYVKDYRSLGSLGLRVYGKREEMIFLGREISEQRDYGDKIADEIDQEVHGLIEQAYNQAKEILTENKDKLIQIADRLIKDETIEGEALESLFNSVAPVMEKPSVKKVSIVSDAELGEQAPKKVSSKKLPGDPPPEPLAQT